MIPDIWLCDSLINFFLNTNFERVVSCVVFFTYLILKLSFNLLTNNNFVDGAVKFSSDIFFPTITGLPYFSSTLENAKIVIISSKASFTCSLSTFQITRIRNLSRMPAKNVNFKSVIEFIWPAQSIFVSTVAEKSLCGSTSLFSRKSTVSWISFKSSSTYLLISIRTKLVLFH